MHNNYSSRELAKAARQSHGGIEGGLLRRGLLVCTNSPIDRIFGTGTPLNGPLRYETRSLQWRKGARMSEVSDGDEQTVLPCVFEVLVCRITRHLRFPYSFGSTSTVRT